MQDARNDLGGDGAQLSYYRVRFVEPPHMGIARREEAVRRGLSRLVLNGHEQFRHCFVN